MKPPRVLLFDVFGTLVDWRSSLVSIAVTSAARSGVPADWASVIDDWRRAYQPAMDQVRSGARDWRDLDSLQRETLAIVLDAAGVSLPADSREDLIRGWRQLRPWPDSREGLDRLRRDHITATLSNGHIALLADLLKFAGLRLDVVLSAQLAGGYKPDPKTYLTALALLDCPPSAAIMVAAHAGDLRAAAALGIRPAFVARPREWGPRGHAETPPDLDGLITASSLTTLADALGC
ncbi:MAG: haloacid dehalogenase type II [Streptosporangiaceae bacterium]